MAEQATEWDSLARSVRESLEQWTDRGAVPDHELLMALNEVEPIISLAIGLRKNMMARVRKLGADGRLVYVIPPEARKEEEK